MSECKSKNAMQTTDMTKHSVLSTNMNYCFLSFFFFFFFTINSFGPPLFLLLPELKWLRHSIQLFLLLFSHKVVSDSL